MSSSEPTAMISAFMSKSLLEKAIERSEGKSSINYPFSGKALDVPVEREEGAVGGDHGAVRGQKRQGPTMLLPPSTTSGCASGVRRTMPRFPPSDAAT